MRTVGLGPPQGEETGPGSLHLTTQEGESPQLLPTDFAGFQYRCQVGCTVCPRNQPSQISLLGLWIHRRLWVGRPGSAQAGVWKRRNVGANSGAVLLMKSGSQLCGWWCPTAPAQEVSFPGHFFL